MAKSLPQRQTLSSRSLFKTRLSGRAWVFTIVLILAHSPGTLTGSSQVLEALTGSVLVKGALNDLQKAADEVIDRAKKAGSSLLSQAGGELDVAITNIRIAESDELDKRVDQMRGPYRQALQQAWTFEQKIDDVIKAGGDLLDTGTLDVMTILGAIPGIDRETFFIQRITGLSKIYTGKDLHFKIKGIGFGADSSQARTDLQSFVIENHPVKCTRTIDQEPFTSDFDISSVDLASFQPKEKTPVVLHAELIVNVTSKRLFFFDGTTTYHVPLAINLFPTYAGSITVTGNYRQAEWKLETKDRQWTYTSPNHDQHDGPVIHFPWTIYAPEPPEVALDDNHQMRNARFWAEWNNGDTRGFSDYGSMQRPAVIIDNGHKATFTENVWGPPFNAHIAADIYVRGLATPSLIASK
jgi:hypothetical protein